MVGADAAGHRRITWPGTQIAVASPPDLDRDIILIRGIEPNMRWRQFCAELLAACDDLGGQLVVTLGALLADTPHTRPIPVTGTATEPELVDRLKLEQSTYEGPTGIVGVLPGRVRPARHPGGVLLGGGPALRRAAAVPQGHPGAARPARGPARGRASRSATCPRTPAPGSAASTSSPRRTRTSPTTSARSRRPGTPPSCPRRPARRSRGSSSGTSSGATGTTEAPPVGRARGLATNRTSGPRAADCGQTAAPEPRSQPTGATAPARGRRRAARAS